MELTLLCSLRKAFEISTKLDVLIGLMLIICSFQNTRPLVKRSSGFEVSERLLADGSVHKKLDEDAVAHSRKVAEGARYRVGGDLASSLLSESGS